MILAFKPQPKDDHRKTWVEYGDRVPCAQDDPNGDLFVVIWQGVKDVEFTTDTIQGALEINRKLTTVFEDGRENMKRAFHELMGQRK